MHGFEENFGLFDVFVDLAAFHGRFWPFFPLVPGYRLHIWFDYSPIFHSKDGSAFRIN